MASPVPSGLRETRRQPLSPLGLGVVLLVASTLTAVAARPDLSHIDGFDDYFLGRQLPGLVAPRWSAMAAVPRAAVLDLRMVADGRAAARFVERFNKDEFAGVVLLLPAVRQAGWAAADLDADGHLDMLIDQADCQETWRWVGDQGNWSVSELPAPLGPTGARFGIVGDNAAATMLIRSVAQVGGWRFRAGRWEHDPALSPLLEVEGERLLTSAGGADRGIRLLDLDGDGQDELLVAGPDHLATYTWSGQSHGWVAGGAAMPVPFVTAAGGDNGVRFIDPDGNGRLTVVLSNEHGFGLFRLDSQRRQFSPLLSKAARDQANESSVPPIAITGEPTGAWWDPVQHDIRPRTQLAGTGPDARQTPVDRPLAFALAYADTLPGFARLLQNDGGNEVYWNYLGDTSPNHFIRQQVIGTRLEWETDTVPEPMAEDTVSFVFAGAMGFISEPATEGFELVAGNGPPVPFDLARTDQEWTSADGTVRLCFRCTFRSSEDAAGLYEISLPRTAVEPGSPTRVTVRSLGQNSARWFAIHPMRYPLPARDRSAD